MNIIKPEYTHKDNRRTLTQLLTANIKQINTYDCNPCTLGGHYHTQGSEYFYVISGHLQIGNEFALTKVNPGEVYCVFPNENHTVVVEAPTKFMTFLTFTFDQENPDLHKENP